MLKEAVKIFVITIVATAMSIGTQVAIAQWQEPTVPPPGGNVHPPINTSGVTQTKDGFLWANGFLTTGTVYVGQIECAGGGTDCLP